jgi:hypothetical protein
MAILTLRVYTLMLTVHVYMMMLTAHVVAVVRKHGCGEGEEEWFNMFYRVEG